MIYDYHLNIRKIYFWYEIEDSKHVIFFPFSTLVTCEMALLRNSGRIRNTVVAYFTQKKPASLRGLFIYLINLFIYLSILS